ncbi:DUF2625 domain-containing protein [Sediminitomix flava]|uniref:Uncharacterized protein DUF2625 n=1 Tax=Sediminitomix flava TaxID=379075 RepID=A0A315Z512_SEDFL|nr:DUF2625 domain-containing protein [Sediminitomix flava]PWJ37905.1 uncharacterized protein DUF2625 [Sediminitomix flava]
MRYTILLLMLVNLQFGFCQEAVMRPLEELINTEEPGWNLVQAWMKEAKNKIEILPKDSSKANQSLFNTQVTTRSPMGAIVYETGGIIVDHGWIRILGSGSEKLKRSLPAWNKGKSFKEYGELMSFLLIADDAIGGLFAVNGGGFGQQDLGSIYYLAPETLNWEPLGIGYSDFIYWAFTGDIADFYKGLRWANWKEEVSEMSADEGINFFPYLWVQYDDLEKLSRKAVPMQEIWDFHMDMRTQLLNN